MYSISTGTKLWMVYAFLGVEYLNSRVIKPVQILESNRKPTKEQWFTNGRN